MYNDDELAALSPHEREHLRRRLEALVDDVSLTHGRPSRERFVGIFAVAVVFLIAWTVYLNRTLPLTYTAGHWRLTWVGFDVALTVILAATAVLAALRVRLLILTAAVGGTLLAFDAWFDTMTARGGDRLVSIATVPLEAAGAVFLLGTAAALLRATATGAPTGPARHGLLAPLPGMRPGGLRSTLAAFRQEPADADND